MKAKIVVVVFILFALLQILPRAWKAWANPEPIYNHSSLAIDTPGGKRFPFTVELALSEEQMEHGLMFRRELADTAGMLFVYPSDRVINMWMENTWLPLDMVFIGADDTVISISPNAVPQSRDIISSQVPARAVLEINGGLAARLGIEPGDKVISPDLPH